MARRGGSPLTLFPPPHPFPCYYKKQSWSSRSCAHVPFSSLLSRALQDTCREFASAAGPKTKYDVFMDATHLVSLERCCTCLYFLYISDLACWSRLPYPRRFAGALSVTVTVTDAVTVAGAHCHGP